MVSYSQLPDSSFGYYSIFQYARIYHILLLPVFYILFDRAIQTLWCWKIFQHMHYHNSYLYSSYCILFYLFLEISHIYCCSIVFPCLVMYQSWSRSIPFYSIFKYIYTQWCLSYYLLLTILLFPLYIYLLQLQDITNLRVY